MNAKQENSQSNPPSANETVTEKVIKSVIFISLSVALVILVLYYGTKESEIDLGIKNQSEINSTGTDDTNTTEKIVRIKRDNVIKQPSCPRSYLLVILQEICTELVVKNELCTPEDFYNKSKHRNPRVKRKIPGKNEPKVPVIMNYIVGGLLITSLLAAFVELYKAKKQVPKKNGKSPLSRKSSLADLTVMKHQRKELIRRESIMEVPEESPHLKQLGSISPSLQRRCSFPAGPNVSNFSESGIAANEEEIIELVSQISTAAEIRKTSISDSRRSSILERRISNDYRMMSIEEKRPSISSIEDSPERRHHRLVHRH